MSIYIGIDLGTTNSAICSYDGQSTRIWKSPEQNDVTPSALYFDRRGNKYVGKRAYDSAPNNPDNAALLFKRLMGSSTPIKIKALSKQLLPEECSAEILKVLFGYLPEEIRQDPGIGTVITVPAAFNQMQKDATMQAARMAGIGKVALMQEPVAAVMSVMKAAKTDGTFLIFDLGGGTLDIAIAESIAGRVNLLAHGGIAMCGGRDFDRNLLDSIVKPWLLEQFDLPEDLTVNPQYKSLMRLAAWAVEKAKIELSSRDEVVISLSESEIRCRDESGEEIYIDIPLRREEFDELIEERVNQAIQAARETLEKAGLSPFDLEKIVFVGGPTNYKPLRDKVCQELGVEGSTDVNPMTAVAEGAALFAESIDWSTADNSRKSSQGEMAVGGTQDLSLRYTARSSSNRAKLVLISKQRLKEGFEYQVDSLVTGWTSGRLPLKAESSLSLPLDNLGPNKFKVQVFDTSGHPMRLQQSEFTIVRTTATVDAIPASYSVGIEVLEKIGGTPVLDYLVRAGDPLPKKGKRVFHSAQSLQAGSYDSLNFKLWEGDIEDPITDNRPIGVLKVSGKDFDEGTIPAGAVLECEYEVEDSGNIHFEVSVPCIGGVFNPGKNFYSRQEGSLDYSEAAQEIAESAEETLRRVEEMQEVISDPKLDEIQEKLERIRDLPFEDPDPETTQEAMETILAAKRQLGQVKKKNLKVIRQQELDDFIGYYNNYVRQEAKQKENEAVENMIKLAQRSINRNDKDFEKQLSELRSYNFGILWRQEWYVIDFFKYYVSRPQDFIDRSKFEVLKDRGFQAVQKGDINLLRQIISELWHIRKSTVSEEDIAEKVNILRS